MPMRPTAMRSRSKSETPFGPQTTFSPANLLRARMHPYTKWRSDATALAFSG